MTFSSHFLSSLPFSASLSLSLPSITLSLFPTHSISLSPLLSIQVSSFLSHQLFPRLHCTANKLSFIQFRFSLNTLKLKWDLSSDLWLFPEPILNFYCRRSNNQRQTPTSLWKLNLLYLFTVTNFSSSLISQNKLNPDVSAFCVSIYICRNIYRFTFMHLAESFISETTFAVTHLPICILPRNQTHYFDVASAI